MARQISGKSNAIFRMSCRMVWLLSHQLDCQTEPRSGQKFSKRAFFWRKQEKGDGRALPPSASNSGPAPAAQPSAGQPQRPPAGQYLGLKRVVIPREQLQPQYLEQVVEKHVGRQISLDDNEVRLSELARIDQFDEQLNRHRADRNYGYSVLSFFVQPAHA